LQKGRGQKGRWVRLCGKTLEPNSRKKGKHKGGAQIRQKGGERTKLNEGGRVVKTLGKESRSADERREPHSSRIIRAKRERGDAETIWGEEKKHRELEREEHLEAGAAMVGAVEHGTRGSGVREKKWGYREGPATWKEAGCMSQSQRGSVLYIK